MKYIAILCLLYAHGSAAQETDSTDLAAAAIISKTASTASKIELQHPSIDKTILSDKKSGDKKPNDNLEVIQVIGSYIGLETPGVTGSFLLDQKFIEMSPKTTGDINELIGLLPGVQVSESANSIEDIAEITALPISISGSQPWQTGFFLDGLNYNNVIDPGSAARLSSSQNTVGGGVQTMNVNSQVISSIEVFDNNIPAEHGDFSGGVVQSRSKSAFDNVNTVFNLGYRGNQSNWGKYHLIYPSESEGAQAILDFDPNIPAFEKDNYSLLFSTRVNERHGMLASVSYVNSTINDLSLGAAKSQLRENINTLVKYSYRNGWIDHLDISLLHAPYKSSTFLKDVLNSDYTEQGGNNALLLSGSQSFDMFELSSSINISRSDSSRMAPPHYYEWERLSGKEWGINIENADDNAVFQSREGGYGNLDNTQTNLNWTSKFAFNNVEYFGISHSVSAGFEWQNRIVERTRFEDHYQYDGARQYSVSNTTAPLNCSGYLLDCVERSLLIPLDDLATNLGGVIDFSNAEHVIAYSNNIVVTPQYFSLRRVYEQERINVNMARISAYITNNMRAKNLHLNIGLRYDYDGFYKNHNIAPRISIGYDVFGDPASQLILGVNRYYSSGQLGYKINEQQKQPYLQYRPINNGFLQGWINFSESNNFRYQFTQLSTPYDDEGVIGWKQNTEHWGHFSVKYVQRWKRNQLSRNETGDLQNDGFKYITFNNNGTGSSARISFAWSAQFAAHSLWFNASYSKNKISNQDYNDEINSVPVDQLVFYGDEIVSKNTLDIIRTNFGRPVTANLGWNVKWAKYLSTGLVATYTGAYTTPRLLNFEKRSELLTSECAECPAINLSLPAYDDVSYEALLLFSLNTTWRMPFGERQNIEFRADIKNLLNSRTYAINENLGFSGIEPGRQFWLGIQYNYN